MDRRDALKGMAAAAGGILLPGAALPAPMYFGWNYQPASLARYVATNYRPYVKQLNAEIKGTGRGKKAFLHLAFEQVTGGKYVPHAQEGPDCVGHAAALGVDFLSAVQIAMKNMPEKWIAKAATEPIYGGSRVEIGGSGLGGGGSTGHWAAQWLQSYGVLHRKKYLADYDFTSYDVKKAIQYGREGCPDALEPIAKQHPVKKAAICTTYNDLCDCIHNGHPVLVCSNVGFGNNRYTLRRDSEGFLRRHRKPWWHAMVFGGYDDEYRRPGALCFNSWDEDWVAGPIRGPQPSSAFWVDASTVDQMLGQGDSFVFSFFQGLPRVEIPEFIFDI